MRQTELVYLAIDPGLALDYSYSCRHFRVYNIYIYIYVLKFMRNIMFHINFKTNIASYYSKFEYYRGHSAEI